ncbi:MAG: SRPBCC family protein [Actinophytocola sp.]|uniref:SRPBCC family protein n=1 Tax=Actinophytocola sp. TaxID=1872138 RepID=UPI003C743351
MTDVTAVIAAPPERVWAVLADGWTYAGWVVGASHVRAVDAGWPEIGARIHHSVGPWPLVVHDTTEVVDVEPGRLLELDARSWPLGAARVRMELSRTDEGGTAVLMSEQVVRGPARLLPGPLQAALLIPRNRESLSRLADIVTAGAGTP